MYVIECSFTISEKSDPCQGIAICSDPDTPVTFVHSDGSPYNGESIWNYTLHHYKPWAKIG